MKLPPAYLDYLSQGRPTEAFLSDDFVGYMMLWPLDEVEQNNREYEVPKYAPGFMCFGSNGGGELLAFDEEGTVFCIPLIGIDPKDAVHVADSWSDLEGFIEPEAP
ncbi:MAG: SMI1/KNR4 family protein [Gemmatales bacterium]